MYIQDRNSHYSLMVCLPPSNLMHAQSQVLSSSKERKRLSCLLIAKPTPRLLHANVALQLSKQLAELKHYSYVFIGYEAAWSAMLSLLNM